VTRPYPPADMIGDPRPLFIPAPELETWARGQFISELSPIYNEEHVHLQLAELGFVWTNVENVKRGRRILGTAQLVSESGDKWSQGRVLHQLREWFGEPPDFVITIEAPHAADATDAAFMALVEHELYHCAQARDEFGQPKFNERTGHPLWAMRGHDVEEFVGVVRRYGADASGVREMVAAANKGAEIADGLISRSCGSCLRLVKG
jgi:hypothetical protein